MIYDIKEIASIIGTKNVVQNKSSINHLIIDSRMLSFPESTLFFAIRTHKNDGHKYIPELYQLRVRNFVVTRELPEYASLTDANFLVVNDTMTALQQLTAYHRNSFEIPVIGVTGSNGKTIVKELLYQLLHTEFNIVRSPRSYNSQLGVPLSVWQMNSKHSLGIFEAGISMPDEMSRLRRIINPTIGIITNIGEAHQENFTSFTQKCDEKLTLFNECEAIIYNADNDIIANRLEAFGMTYKGIGWSRKDPESPLFIEAIQKSETETEIQCVMLRMSHVFTVPFTDDASIENVIHCIALLLYLKPTLLRKVDSFKKLEPVAMRLEAKEGVRNCQLINDTYNSDINSLSIALDFLQSRKADRTMKSTVILSDILQSGMRPHALYKKVADLLKSKHVDRLIGIGRDLKEYEEVFDMKKEFYWTTDDLIHSSTLKKIENEIILLKGSRVFYFERITELLEKKTHETILEVNLDALIHNYNHFRSQLQPNTKMICMVKAFGYGAGSDELAKTLQEYRCDYLAVALVDEGKELREEGISIPILVMNPEYSSFNELFEYRLEPEVYSFRLLDALIKEAERRGVTAFPIHIKIDTGMHRLGFQPGDMQELCHRLKNQQGLYVSSVFSHLAGSDEEALDHYTLKQISAYQKAASELQDEIGYPVVRHILNSAGVERFANYQMDMVRLGIALYGISTIPDSKELKPVSTLKTTILQIQEIAAGESVGYGRKSYVNRDSRIAIIPIGYADGYDRHLSNGVGEVSIHGKRYPVIGNICMDITMIDVTGSDVKEGDPVIIFGKDLPVTEIAGKLNTIPYEILTSVSSRVKRVYFRE